MFTNNLFIAILNAICYAAYQAMSSEICVCNADETSFGLLKTAFNMVLDEMLECNMVSDISEVYDQVVFLVDVDYFDGIEELVSNNPYEDILNALIYSMEQCATGDIDVCHVFNGETFELSKQHTMDLLLIGYYHYQLQSLREGAAIDVTKLWQYSELTIKETENISACAKTIKAWYFMEKARITADANDAWALVDQLYDQCILSDKIAHDIG